MPFIPSTFCLQGHCARWPQGLVKFVLSTEAINSAAAVVSTGVRKFRLVLRDLPIVGVWNEGALQAAQQSVVSFNMNSGDG